MWRCRSTHWKFQRFIAARRVQSWWRCRSAFAKFRRFCAARSIQNSWRFARARALRTRLNAIRKIQTWYRSQGARIRYQNRLVDIVIVQNVCRMWVASRKYNRLRAERWTNAATKIQATWRGFQDYTDFVFAVVDVLTIQRATRQWLAKRKVIALRQQASDTNLHRSATKIQAHWRRRRAEIFFLMSLVRIIIVQSVVRRYLVKSIAAKAKTSGNSNQLAAIKIQAAWRGFCSYSNYVIASYQIVRLQAVIRGKLTRSIMDLRLGCCIMIQAMVRRVIAVRKVDAMKDELVMRNSRAQKRREVSACQRIQFWWRVVMDCRKEKAAALVIERFFCMVKQEVDREVRRAESRRSAKKETDQRPPKDRLSSGSSSVKLGPGRVWLATDPDGQVDVLTYSKTSSDSLSSDSINRSSSTLSDNSKNSKKSRKRVGNNQRSVSHRASSPPMNLVMRHELEDDQSTEGEQTDEYDEDKDVQKESLSLTYTTTSEISASPSSVQGKPLTPSKLLSNLYDEDLAREERNLDALIKQNASSSPRDYDGDREEALAKASLLLGKERQSSAQKYINKFGLQPNRSFPSKTNKRDGNATTRAAVLQEHHFFADDLESSSSSADGGRSQYSRRSGSRSVRSTSETPRASSKGISRSRKSDPISSSTSTKGGRYVGRESPRKGKILVMNPYPDYPTPKKDSSLQVDVDVDYVGEEFGLI